MSKHIYNPYLKVEGYHCFGCSASNPIGLHLHFVDEGEVVTATWMPSKNYEGWMNVLHGGIQATLMDEIASWLVFTKLETAGVTRQMEVKYKKPVLISDGEVKLCARMLSVHRSMAEMEVSLESAGIIKSQARVVYYLYPKDEAEKTFYYPGSDAFYCQD